MGQQVTMPAGKKKSQSFIHSFIHWKAVHSVGDHRSIDPFFSLFPHKKMNKYNGRQWQKCPLPRSLAIHIWFVYIMYMLYLSYAMLCYAMLWCSRQIDSTSLSLPICMCTWMHHCTTVCCAVISILHMKSQLLSVVFGMLFNSYSR